MIKIADFGSTKRVPNCLLTLCYTLQYIAQEALELKGTGYNQRADMLSIGIVVYILLGGYAPFKYLFDSLAQAIISGEYEFDDLYLLGILEDAKDMISNLLQVDPQKRLSAEEALNCELMRLEECHLDTSVLALYKVNFHEMINCMIKVKKKSRLEISEVFEVVDDHKIDLFLLVKLVSMLN